MKIKDLKPGMVVALREAQEKDFMARLKAQGITVRQTYRIDAPLGMTLKDAEALLERLEGQA